jgi:hypothetical protein
MNWYIARIVFQIVCGNGDHTPQFDEQVRMITACSGAEAFNKARQIGLQEEETFYNLKQQLVKWTFINVSEINKLSELADGIEICSRIEEVENAENYIQFVNGKAEQILHKTSHPSFEPA